MIAIIDYGMGNIHSVRKALELFGAQALVTNDAGQIACADKVILPGVGAFDDAVAELDSRGFRQAIRDYVSIQHRPLLGICLGMQLLFDRSEEGSAAGLGLIPGEVKRFKRTPGVKVPHMGWNRVLAQRRDCPLFRGIDDGAFVYFCHSYYPRPDDDGVSAARTDYFEPFTSVVWKDSLYGMQFHPEKSQAVGLRMLENFVRL